MLVLKTKKNKIQIINKAQVLLAFWNNLMRVTQFTFHAKTPSKDKNGWDRKGQGRVVVKIDDFDTLTFSEIGTWQEKQFEKVSFSNSLRWKLDRQAGVISLEHMRRGPNHPVFLFYLTPIDKHALSAINPHICGKDAYFGQIHFKEDTLQFKWKVCGPMKNEEISYNYTP